MPEEEVLQARRRAAHIRRVRGQQALQYGVDVLLRHTGFQAYRVVLQVLSFDLDTAQQAVHLSSDAMSDVLRHHCAD